MPKSTLLTVKCCLCRNQPGFNKVEKPMAVALCSSGDKPGMLGVQVHRQGRLLLPEGAGEPPFLQHPSSRRHKQIATQINKGVSGRDTEQHPCVVFFIKVFFPPAFHSTLQPQWMMGSRGRGSWDFPSLLQLPGAYQRLLGSPPPEYQLWQRYNQAGRAPSREDKQAGPRDCPMETLRSRTCHCSPS